MRQPWPQFQVPAQRAEIHVPPRAAFGILEIEARAEGILAAGQHHDRGVGIVFEAARGICELTQRFRRQRIDAVAAVEPHHGDTPLGPVALFDRHEIRHKLAPCRLFSNSIAQKWPIIDAWFRRLNPHVGEAAERNLASMHGRRDRPRGAPLPTLDLVESFVVTRQKKRRWPEDRGHALVTGAIAVTPERAPI